MFSKLKGEWKWSVKCFKGGTLASHTVHKTDFSKDIEVEAAESLKAQGHYDEIRVSHGMAQDAFRERTPSRN